MGLRTVMTEGAPAASGPYSQAIAGGGLLFVSGQLPLVPGRDEVAGYGEVNEVYRTVFGDWRPARSVIEVSALPRGARLRRSWWRRSEMARGSRGR